MPRLGNVHSIFRSNFGFSTSIRFQVRASTRQMVGPVTWSKIHFSGWLAALFLAVVSDLWLLVFIRFDIIQLNQTVMLWRVEKG